MTGKVSEWSDDKGYGTILGNDDINYFCHGSAIQAQSFSLDVGDTVDFTPQDSKRGKMATLVHKRVMV